MIGFYWEVALLHPEIAVLNTTQPAGEQHGAARAPAPVPPPTPPRARDAAQSESTDGGKAGVGVTPP